jgi:hypothetical protein
MEPPAQKQDIFSSPYLDLLPQLRAAPTSQCPYISLELDFPNYNKWHASIPEEPRPAPACLPYTPNAALNEQTLAQHEICK